MAKITQNDAPLTVPVSTDDSLCTAHKARQIAAFIEAGFPFRGAAKFAGISPAAANRWRARALLPGAPQVLIDFDRIVSRAEFDTQKRLLAAHELETSTKSIEWHLEKLDPDTWGSKNELTIKQSVAQDLTNDQLLMEAAEIIKALPSDSEVKRALYEDLRREYTNAIEG